MRIIYQHLFYNAYMDGKNSKNYSDSPFFYASGIVTWCLLSNIEIIICILKKLGYISNTIFKIDTRLSVGIYAVIVYVVVYCYYRMGNRYKKILHYYDNKYSLCKNKIAYIYVVLLYLICSTASTLATIVFVNEYWK